MAGPAATIKTGERPRGIAISKDGKFVYVAVGDDDAIEILDTATSKIVGKLPSGPDPEQFAIDPEEHFVYVANEDDAAVSVIDLNKRKLVGKIPVGLEPEGIAVSPDGKIAAGIFETAERAKEKAWMVRLWDVKTGKALGRPLYFSEWVTGVQFSSDASTFTTFEQLLAGQIPRLVDNEDRTKLRIWRTPELPKR